MLRTERGADADVASGGERIERVSEIGRDGGRMREQRDALAGKRRAERFVFKQTIETEFHGASSYAKESAWWKSGLPGGCLSAQ